MFSADQRERLWRPVRTDDPQLGSEDPRTVVDTMFPVVWFWFFNHFSLCQQLIWTFCLLFLWLTLSSGTTDFDDVIVVGTSLSD